MTDRPILFSAPMIKALLAGTKTQTRRVLKGLGEQPIIEYDGMFMWKEGYRWGAVTEPKFPPGVRFAKGDRLWVREAWRAAKGYDAYPPREMSRWPVHYEADGQPDADDDMGMNGRLRASMHMPRWASRLTLLVTDVRVERLQDISEEDARAEGIVQHGRFYGLADADWDDAELSAIKAYARLWDAINGEGAWDTNPWIVAYSFAVERRNIDAEG